MRADAIRKPARFTASRARWRQLRGSLAALRALPGTARYLLAFLLFNDAIQAVIALSSVVLQNELFVAKGLPAVTTRRRSCCS